MTLVSKLAGLGGVLGVVVTAFAHVDDPKELAAEPAYVGPGWRSSDGGLPPVGFASDNVELLSWLPLGELGGSSANDCWGYTSPSGDEYAIICLGDATVFVDITDPTDPTIIESIPSNSCTWHDVKIFEDVAYVVSECGLGIQVIDLSQIDSGVVTHVRNVTSGGPDSHNVAINEESGYLYRTGGSGNGFLIYDLNADKLNPPLVATWPDRYVHDAQIVNFTSGPYAGREIAFTCGGDGNGGDDTGLEILDVTNKANIFTLDRFFYSNAAYSHQGWLSTDRQYFYLNDELDEGTFGTETTTRVLDVSDLENVSEAAIFTSGNGATDHNLYVRDDGLIFEANYRSGLRVFDNSSDALNPTQVGFFDTVPEDDDSSTSGAWSNFPYFPSKNVIISDRSKGLFVVKYLQALLSYEFPSGLPEQIDPSGDAIEVRIVELSKGGLVEGTETFHYDAGSGFLSVPLVNIGGDLYEANFPATPCGVEVAYYFSAEQMDGNTLTSPPGAPGSSYSTLSANDVLIAFEDDSESDPGWTITTTGGGTTGEWDRGVPINDDREDPPSDYDGSGSAWVTGNTNDEDVDGGPTEMVSPAFDLSTANAPFLSYARWISVSGGDPDFLDIYISNDDGASWTLIESVTGAGGWVVNTFAVESVITPLTSQMRLRIETADNPNDSVTEAAMDAFEVISVSCDAPCPNDIDGSGTVDFGDILAVLAAWGEMGVPEDVDGSGEVDFGDILLLLADWGTMCP